MILSLDQANSILEESFIMLNNLAYKFNSMQGLPTPPMLRYEQGESLLDVLNRLKAMQSVIASVLAQIAVLEQKDNNVENPSEDILRIAQQLSIGKIIRGEISHIVF